MMMQKNRVRNAAIPIVLLAITCTGCQRPNATAGYAAFGEPFEPAKTTRLGTVLDNPEQYAKNPVLIRAKVAGVCKKMGCWMTLTDGAHTARVRFTKSDQCKDGYFVPRNAQGHDCYVKCVVQETEISEATARHYAEDAGKSPEEIKRIVGPQKDVTLLASGVLLSDGDSLDPPVR